MYRCEAASVEGFIQQLAVAYVTHGYWFYVTGQIPDHKDPPAVDRKLIAKYHLDISKWTRCRRKKAGLANVQYLRYGSFFVLLATQGQHPFFDQEPQFRDLRHSPIHCFGYSISYRQGNDARFHASVRISRPAYHQLKTDLLILAKHGRTTELEHRFRRLPFAPYAPVRRQMLNLLRKVNAVLKTSGKDCLEWSILPLRRRSIRVAYDFKQP